MPTGNIHALDCPVNAPAVGRVRGSGQSADSFPHQVCTLLVQINLVSVYREHVERSRSVRQSASGAGEGAGPPDGSVMLSWHGQIGDLVRFRGHPDLPQHCTGSMVHGRHQLHPCASAARGAQELIAIENNRERCVAACDYAPVGRASMPASTRWKPLPTLVACGEPITSRRLAGAVLCQRPTRSSSRGLLPPARIEQNMSTGKRGKRCRPLPFLRRTGISRRGQGPCRDQPASHQAERIHQWTKQSQQMPYEGS